MRDSSFRRAYSMAKSKRKKQLRTAEEFNPVKLAAALHAPRRAHAERIWEADSIVAARAAQARGEFHAASKLAYSILYEPAIYAALLNRLAPPQGLPSRLVPPKESSKALRVLDEAEALFGAQGVGISPGTVWELNRQLALHEIGFGYNVLTPRPDGSRLDIELRAWPIEFVRWDPTCRSYKALTEGGAWEEITHGDGRWVVVKKGDLEPHKNASLLSLALVWMDTALGKRDRAQTSTSHGNAKMVGTLPQGIGIDSPEGAALLGFLANMHESLPYGVIPNGAVVDMITNNSTAWQIFSEITKEGLADAARILLGNDGLTRASGSNYIRDGYIWGVRNDIVEADLKALERAIHEGTIQVWAALNFGDSSLAPYRQWLMPDTDEDARRESLATRTKGYHEALKGYRDAGMVVDQAFADAIASEFGVKAGTLIPTAGAGMGDASPAAGTETQTAGRLVALPGRKAPGR